MQCKPIPSFHCAEFGIYSQIKSPDYIPSTHGNHPPTLILPPPSSKMEPLQPDGVGQHTYTRLETQQMADD